MNTCAVLSHASLAGEGPFGLDGGGLDCPQPDTTNNKAPDKAAPLARDFHMTTPLFIISPKAKLKTIG
jgi:hypothetical protein